MEAWYIWICIDPGQMLPPRSSFASGFDFEVEFWILLVVIEWVVAVTVDRVYRHVGVVRREAHLICRVAVSVAEIDYCRGRKTGRRVRTDGDAERDGRVPFGVQPRDSRGHLVVRDIDVFGHVIRLECPMQHVGDRGGLGPAHHGHKGDFSFVNHL